MLDRLRSPAVWIGRILSVASIAAVAAWFVRMQVWRNVDFRDPRLYAALAAGVAIYVVGFAALGYGWVRRIESAGALSFPAAEGIRIYCRSQIAKYIPGNFFQYVARHVSAKRLGATHSALILASVTETAALVAVAVALAALGGGLPARLSPFQRAAAFAAALPVLAAAVPLAAKLGGADRIRRPRGWRWFDAVFTLLLSLPLFVGNSVCLAMLLSLNHAGTQPPAATLVAIWSISWLAGYLVPGSPGGLGVRDAALVFALSGWYSRPDALVVATEMRLVSTLGDVTLWLGARS